MKLKWTFYVLKFYVSSNQKLYIFSLYGSGIKDMTSLPESQLNNKLKIKYHPWSEGTF